jgi:hypothetical protein
MVICQVAPLAGLVQVTAVSPPMAGTAIPNTSTPIAAASGRFGTNGRNALLPIFTSICLFYEQTDPSPVPSSWKNISNSAQLIGTIFAIIQPVALVPPAR